jgi:hypothetical protein
MVETGQKMIKTGQEWTRSSSVPITIEESLLELESMEEEGDLINFIYYFILLCYT